MTTGLAHIGRFTCADSPAFDAAGVGDAARRARETCFLVQDDAGHVGVSFAGAIGATGALKLLGVLPPLYPEWLGDRSFTETHGVRFPYVVGEMANGIATAEMVIAAAHHGCLGFFGAAGLPPARIEQAIDTIEAALQDGEAWGANLIHSPHEPDLENAVVDLFLRRSVRRVSASAYMDLTPMVVRYAATGLFVDDQGRIGRAHHVFAKVSRPEVAAKFMRPPPQAMLQALVDKGALTAEEARLAALLPVAEDVTVEADSGGHTDNQALPCVFPTVAGLRDVVVAEHGRPIRVGAAGGLGTPQALAAAFAMGASYVLTGSVNQSATESGLSPKGKDLLCGARLGDVMMAPAADMFEMGVKVQVLKKGSMFAVRAQRLYDVYRAHASWAAVPKEDQARIQKDMLRTTFDEAWAKTHAFFQVRDPRENAKAAADPKHKMALVFRSYLGQASKWAIAGDDQRALDFQIWCGPAMGAFNAWVDGSFLAPPAARTTGQIALNLLEGAVVVARAGQLRAHGAPVPERAFTFAPRPLSLHGSTDGVEP